MNGRPRLLLVDDEPTVGLIAQRMAVRDGHDLVHVRDAEEAWAYLQATATPPDLILLDVKLPGMSGTDLFQRIRAAPRLQSVPAALLSQSSLPETIARAVRLGIDFHVAKDLLSQPDQWSARIREVLDDARSGDDWLDESECSSIGSVADLKRHVEAALQGASRCLPGAEVGQAVLVRSAQRCLGILNADGTIGNLSDGVWQALSAARRDTSLSVPRLAGILTSSLCRQFRALLGSEQAAPLMASLQSIR